MADIVFSAQHVIKHLILTKPFFSRYYDITYLMDRKTESAIPPIANFKISRILHTSQYYWKLK